MDSDLEDMSDEELANFLEFRRKSRVYIPFRRKSCIEHFTETEFFNKFHMSKSTAMFAFNEILELIEPQSTKNNPIQPEQMFLLTLSFLANGGMLGKHADHFGISPATANRVVKKVLGAICSLRRKYIHFPKKTDVIKKTVEDFYKIAKFPDVVAAVGTTHVRMQQSPGAGFGDDYLNANLFYSLKVQMLCDANLKILDIIVCPGGMTDKIVYENSKIFKRFSIDGNFKDKLVVADDTYPSKTYFMKPLSVCLASQRPYNDAQIATRKPIENTFLLWKSRFQVLVKGLWINVYTIEEITIATAILHNICCKHNEFELPPIESEIEARIQTTMNVCDNEEDSPESIDDNMEEMIDFFRNKQNENKEVTKNESTRNNKTTNQPVEFEDAYINDVWEYFERN